MAEVVSITITENVGEVKLGNTILPGIYQSLEVSKKVRLDEAKVPGRSGATKQPTGFEDAEVTLELALANDDSGSALSKLKTIVQLFQGQDSLARPYVYTIVHPLLAAWGIRHVMFRDLKSRDDNQSDLIYASLVFVEHAPPTIKKEQRRPKQVPGKKQNAAQSGGVVLYADQDVLGLNPYSVPYENIDAFVREMKPGRQQTPAVDDDGVEVR